MLEAKAIWRGRACADWCTVCKIGAMSSETRLRWVRARQTQTAIGADGCSSLQSIGHCFVYLQDLYGLVQIVVVVLTTGNIVLARSTGRRNVGIALVGRRSCILIVTLAAIRLLC